MPPTLHANLLSALCSLGPRPNTLTGYFRQWFINHFSKEEYIEHPELRGLLWKKLVEDTKIEVESITRWKPQTTEFRPAIVIKRNDWKVVRGGIDDRHMVTKIVKDSQERYTSFIRGSHTLFCVSNEPTQAEILGAEVYRELVQFGPLVRQELQLMRFQAMAVGSLFEIEEARENYAVPVTVAYGLQESWRLIPYAPKLKTIDLSNFLP